MTSKEIMCTRKAVLDARWEYAVLDAGWDHTVLGPPWVCVPSPMLGPKTSKDWLVSLGVLRKKLPEVLCDE